MSDETYQGAANNRYLDQKKSQTKRQIENVFEEYKKLLRDKTHPDNHTQGIKNNIISALNRLVTAADELDNVNPGEGIFGLIILSLRSILKVKDEVVKLEYDLKELRREVERLKKSAR